MEVGPEKKTNKRQYEDKEGEPDKKLPRSNSGNKDPQTLDDIVQDLSKQLSALLPCRVPFETFDLMIALAWNLAPKDAEWKQLVDNAASPSVSMRSLSPTDFPALGRFMQELMRQSVGLVLRRGVSVEIMPHAGAGSRAGPNPQEDMEDMAIVLRRSIGGEISVSSSRATSNGSFEALNYTPGSGDELVRAFVLRPSEHQFEDNEDLLNDLFMNPNNQELKFRRTIPIRTFHRKDSSPQTSLYTPDGMPHIFSLCPLCYDLIVDRPEGNHRLPVCHHVLCHTCYEKMCQDARGSVGLRVRGVVTGGRDNTIPKCPFCREQWPPFQTDQTEVDRIERSYRRIFYGSEDPSEEQIRKRNKEMSHAMKSLHELKGNAGLAEDAANAANALESILDLKKTFLRTDEALSWEQFLNFYKTLDVWVRMPRNEEGSNPDDQFPEIKGDCYKAFITEIIRALLGPPSFVSQRLMEESMERQSRNKAASEWENTLTSEFFEDLLKILKYLERYIPE